MLVVLLQYFKSKNKLGRKKWKKSSIIQKLAWEMIKICVTIVHYVKKLISSEDFIARHREKSTHFTRKRCLPFPTLILFLCNLLRSSIQNELDKFFKTISTSEMLEKKVDASAFFHARKKIKHQAFIELNQKSVDFFYQNAKPKTWHNFHLRVIDGSTVRLPNSTQIREEFGDVNTHSNGVSCPMAQVSLLSDPINDIIVDSAIKPIDWDERVLAYQHIESLKPGDLLLMDRGYPAFWFFQAILRKGAHLCARLTVSHWKCAQEFVQSGLDEQLIEIQCSQKSKLKCRQYNLPEKKLTLRMIRVQLNTGEVEVLITSLLDQSLFPYELFLELYPLRWSIEEKYKIYKSRLEVENFTGKSVGSIYQDFYANTFTCNMVSILAKNVQDAIPIKCQKRKLCYKINWTQAFAKMKEGGMRVFFSKNCLKYIHNLQKLFMENISCVRPGRSFPRKHKVGYSIYAFGYKPIS